MQNLSHFPSRSELQATPNNQNNHGQHHPCRRQQTSRMHSVQVRWREIQRQIRVDRQNSKEKERNHHSHHHQTARRRWFVSNQRCFLQRQGAFQRQAHDVRRSRLSCT